MVVIRGLDWLVASRLEVVIYVLPALLVGPPLSWLLWIGAYYHRLGSWWVILIGHCSCPCHCQWLVDLVGCWVVEQMLPSSVASRHRLVDVVGCWVVLVGAA